MERRGDNMMVGPPEIPMARGRCPHLYSTLIVDVNYEGSVNEEDWDKDANVALAVYVAINVDKNGVGRQDDALDRETGRGRSVLLLSTDPSLPPFDPGQRMAYFDLDKNLANVTQIGRRESLSWGHEFYLYIRRRSIVIRAWKIFPGR